MSVLARDSGFRAQLCYLVVNRLQSVVTAREVARRMRVLLDQGHRLSDSDGGLMTAVSPRPPEVVATRPYPERRLSLIHI